MIQSARFCESGSENSTLRTVTFEAKGFRGSRNECSRCERNAILKGLLPVALQNKVFSEVLCK